MKHIIRPIWNYLIGLRNGHYPNILCENIGQYPIKFWCEVLWIYVKNNHDFAITYINNDTDSEITYEQYLKEYEIYLQDKEKWYKNKFQQNHSKNKQRFLKFHYWLNNIA